jgi:uncharacterized membrane protein
MNPKPPSSMSDILGDVLRFGVILASLVIAFGFLIFLFRNSGDSASSFIQYYPNKLPHGDFGVSPSSIASGLRALNPYSVIELGLLILLATPVSRVFLSVLLFQVEGDRKYVYITLGVLLILLFSMLVTPFIPGFGG